MIYNRYTVHAISYLHAESEAALSNSAGKAVGQPAAEDLKVTSHHNVPERSFFRVDSTRSCRPILILAGCHSVIQVQFPGFPPTAQTP